MPNMYSYVSDCNQFIDPFGLDELYALVARKDGWYPVMEWGKKKPIGEIFLKKGELWKIGTSKDSSKRYTIKYLKELGKTLAKKDAGVVLKVLHSDISKLSTRVLERLKITGYEAWKGFLPAGNKCRH